MVDGCVQEVCHPGITHSIPVSADVIAPTANAAFSGAYGVYPWSKPLGIAIPSFRRGEIDKTPPAPVAGGGEEDEEQEGAVDAGPVEEVCC